MISVSENRYEVIYYIYKKNYNLTIFILTIFNLQFGFDFGIKFRSFEIN